MSPLELAAILGMALATYLTRIGGLALANDCIEVGGFTERFMKNLPPAILAALISPKLMNGDASIWGAAVLTVGIVWYTKNTLFGVAAGTLGCAAIRWMIG